MNMLVKDIMTTDVIWAEEDTPFVAVAAAMHQYRISALPVLDTSARVIGVVSETDLLAKEALACGADDVPGMITGLHRHRELGKARATVARDLMTAPAVTIGPENTVANAARLMYLHGVRRLPVTDSSGHLAGIVTRADVLTVYARPDADIREDILTGVVRGQRHAEPGSFGVGVRDGVVTVTGRPLTRAQGHEVVCLIRHIEGVVDVRDRLAYPDPAPGFDVLASFPAD